MTWKGIVREFIPPIAIKVLRRSPPPTPGGFFSFTKTVAEAKAAGLSLRDYVKHQVNDTSGQIIEKLHNLGAVTSATQAVVEIGAGTGRFVEQTLKHCRPTRYQIYEIDREWSAWLAKTYPVEACVADGQSLKSTESASSDFIHAHGVFVYLPFLTSYRYFLEIARIAASRAFVAFDIISERCLDAETVDKWLKSGHSYPCFLSQAYVRQVFEGKGFRYVGGWREPSGPGLTEYLVFTH